MENRASDVGALRLIRLHGEMTQFFQKVGLGGQLGGRIVDLFLYVRNICYLCSPTGCDSSPLFTCSVSLWGPFLYARARLVVGSVSLTTTTLTVQSILID